MDEPSLAECQIALSPLLESGIDPLGLGGIGRERRHYFLREIRTASLARSRPLVG